MSGISSGKWALEKVEVEFYPGMAARVLEVVKSIGQNGRTVGLSELPYTVEWCKENTLEGQI